MGCPCKNRGVAKDSNASHHSTSTLGHNSTETDGDGLVQWQASHGDILDVSADILICSANIYLTMSGGVGGAFLQRYGSSMHDALQAYLESTGKRHVERGQIVKMLPHGSPYTNVLHAVAVDGLYESSSEVISQIVTRCLAWAAELGARKVALPLLATGYGHLSVPEFITGIRNLIHHDFATLERVVICARSKYDLQELLEGLPSLRSARSNALFAIRPNHSSDEHRAFGAAAASFFRAERAWSVLAKEKGFTGDNP